MKHIGLACLALGFMVLLAPPPAWAQVINETVNIRFGKVVVPGSGGTIQIDPDDTVSTGSNLIVTPPAPNAGHYRITGAAGSVDISISGVTTCDPALSFAAFPADWRGTSYADLSGGGIVGEVFDGDDDLYIGARINFAGGAPIGACAVNYDLNITIY